MRSSTVSAPVESCNLGQSPPHSRFAAVQLLTNQLLYFIVEPKSRTKELYSQTCSHLAAQGMADTGLFGLSIVSDGEYLFVDPDYKLSKYAPKNWRSSSTNGLDSNGKPLLTFHFRVQFYVESPLLLRDEVSKHHYYLQLRHNVLTRGLLHACASEEVLYLLAGLALQADFGDYKDTNTNNAYFQAREYFPQQMACTGAGESRIVQTASSLHRANNGLSKGEAETQFIREASSPDTSPLTHNAHVYRLKHRKQDPGPGNVLLAICTRGIELYEENSTKALSGTFLWNDIGKLCFDRKKFEIRALNWPASGEKLTYYTNNDEKSKHLLSLCRVTHQFSMAIQPRLVEVRRKEEEERKRYRDWGMELSGKLSSGHYNNQVCHRGDQRISVISSTSSNTTSGIVSDRVHSLDESEDDLELEIMINSPPAPSVESLALAHLQDTLGSCGHTTPSPHPVTEINLQGKGCGDSTSAMTISAVKSTLISGAATPATTDGSQCSSSCSTVVVAGTTAESVGLKEEQRIVSGHRRPSTSSSLELGFSHTAQNSAISDTASTCLELDYSVQSAHTSSGVYTLRSSCGTTNTVANTVACSSETSGICVEESDGHRSRSGSLVSASGSFHGDGSDPSDAGQGTLLTAEELSDLIVGRSPKPRRGVYPSRATVSSTLDSDSDYVTLPPPPPPPPRSDSERQSNYVLLESSSLSSPEETLATPLRLDDSLSNLSLSSRKSMEESLLQQQIQFQHLASSFSPHKQNLHLNQYQISQPNHMSIPRTGGQILTTNSPHISDLNKLHKYLSSAPPQYQTQYVVTNPSQTTALDQALLSQAQYQPLGAEEATARFITSKPHINILTAHTSLVPSTASPSFAAPTLAYQTPIPANCGSTQIRSHLPSYPLDPASRMKIKTHQNSSNLIPIVGSNNYLDVRGSGAAFLQHFHQKFPPPPPPVLHPRQPPPPPPPPPRTALQTVYTSQVTRSQIEQFKQQLYSDVDYVIYPMQDPAISKQEYLDSKIALSHYNQVYPPPPYPSYSGKSHVVYRSTPNVAVASGYIPVSFNNQSVGPSTVKYASNQNLSTEYAGYPGSSLSFLNRYHSSTSPLYSAGASYSSSSTQSLRYDPLIQMAVPKLISPVLGSGFTRTQSDDNILNCGYEKQCLEVPRIRRPPPPLPPPYDLQSQLPITPKKVTFPKTQTQSKATSPPSLPIKAADVEPAQTTGKSAVDGLLDIRTLREKSRNMDLPLISALCNDRSLLKQTNAFVMPRHPADKKNDGRPLSWHVETSTKKNLDLKNIPTSNSIDSSDGTAKKSSLFSSFLSSKSISNPTTPTKHSSYSTSSNSKLKYPVSGLSTTQIVKPGRKTTSRHTHPSDKVSGQTKVNRSRSSSSTTTSSTNVSDTILP